MAGAARAAAAQTNPVVTNPASAESWAFLEAILQSRPAVSIPRLMCGTLRGSARGVTAGSEMAAAVADDTHRFCHRCDQLIASLEAIDQDVPVEPAAAVKAAVASTTAAPADTPAAVKAAAVSASTAAAVKAAAVLPATAARVAAATADTAAAVKAAAAPQP